MGGKLFALVASALCANWVRAAFVDKAVRTGRHDRACGAEALNYGVFAGIRPQIPHLKREQRRLRRSSRRNRWLGALARHRFGAINKSGADPRQLATLTPNTCSRIIQNI